MNKNVVVGLIVLVAVVGGGFLLMNKNQMSPETTAPMEVTQAPDAMEKKPAVDADGMERHVVEVTVTGSNFSFDTKEIRAKEGDLVRVTFKNADGFHDFVLDEFNVKTKQIPGGSEETVEFVADKKGTFEYYCSVGQHRQNGMFGKLIVE